MAKHLKFEGIEINGSLEDFIAKLEAIGYCVEMEPIGEQLKLVSLRGEFSDYDGICGLLVATNTKNNVEGVVISGEEHYSVDDVLDDFEYFRSKAEEYERYGLELFNEEDDYFDEDDIESIRDETLHKSVFYKNELDDSCIIVSVKAKDDDDTFYVSMSIFDGQNRNADNEHKKQKILNEQLADAQDRLAQIGSNHLFFSGIEMDGSIEDFVEELKAKGFRTEMDPEWINESEMARMRGPFMGEPCNLTLVSNNFGDIALVLVKMRERKSFEVIKDEFYKLLEIYKKKYGEPDEVQEELVDMRDPITALRNDKGSMGAMFRFESTGSISILIAIDEDSKYPHITIAYADRINTGSNADTDDDIEDIDVDDIDMDDYYDDI